MQMITIVHFFVFGFLGYVIGRIGDQVGGHWDLPHHWIYGVLMVFLGVTFYLFFIGNFLTYFGIGVFVSDIRDFFNARFWGPDKDTDKSFFGFD